MEAGSRQTFTRDGIEAIHAKCEDVLQDLPAASIDLIVTDPPYFRVKGEWWDRQWSKPEGFLSWMGELCDEWRRVLKPNGSLYVFASPQMSHAVEGEVRKRFQVLANIRWVKSSGWHQRQCEEALRTFFPASESIVFAEQRGTESLAKSEAGYVAKCDEIRGSVFEPLRAYLDAERERSGFTVRQVAEAFQKKSGSRTVTGMAGHWFGSVQWALPTEDNYAWLRGLLNRDGGDNYLRREYEDLRREYEDLRREYEDLRRPFYADDKRPYTDVWDYPTVQDYPGKHPCEKPLAMIEHIIETSSRPGDLVLDCFAGSGVVGKACRNFGRRAILCEVESKWHQKIVNDLRQGSMFAEAS